MKSILKIFSAGIILLSAITSNAQPPKVPASVRFAGETIDLTSEDRFERMDRELLTFTYMHSTSTLMLKRADRIFKVVVPILKEQGVPEDLKYLMVIESNLDTKAYSPAGAAGLWQFMQTAGREYGLEVNANVDERYHIEKATRAACKYLKSSYAKYGNWMTVAASYNAGQGGISKRLEEQRQKNALDLWLNAETSRYMFRILAAKMMFENPAAFGFNIGPGDRYPVIPVKEVVTVTDTVEDLVKFALDHGVTYAQLKEANLWLRESRLNDSSHRTYRIVIPKY